jgi:peptidoglycan/xylan/chitin deacetylase (PgdA/CDA1 family)
MHLMFRTLVFHEIRPEDELSDQPRPIDVADGYQDALPLPLFNSCSHFKQQIDFLKAEKYHTLTLQEVKDYYYQKQPLPEKSVLLTFDDCYQSMKEYAYPILKEAGFKATAFVVSGWLFSEPSSYQPEVSKTLSLAELSDMEDVFEYANHTSHFHERKGTMGRSMWEPADKFAFDLVCCNQIVAIQDVFAYPFGFYDQKTIKTLEENDFILSFTTIPGVNMLETPKMELRRDIVPPIPLAEFKKMFQNEL